MVYMCMQNHTIMYLSVLMFGNAFLTLKFSIRKPSKCKLRIFHLYSVREKERPVFPASYTSSNCPPIPSSTKTQFLSHTELSFPLFGDIISFYHSVLLPGICCPAGSLLVFYSQDSVWVRGRTWGA